MKKPKGSPAKPSKIFAAMHEKLSNPSSNHNLESITPKQLNTRPSDGAFGVRETMANKRSLGPSNNGTTGPKQTRMMSSSNANNKLVGASAGKGNTGIDS